MTEELQPHHSHTDSSSLDSEVFMAPAKSWKENLKGHFEGFKKKIVENLNRENIKKKIQSFDPQSALDWITKAVQKRGAALYGALATITLATFFVSDLTSLILGEYIPEPPSSRLLQANHSGSRYRSVTSYDKVFTRNLFSSRGLIPGEDNGSKDKDGEDLGGTPVRTSLPLKLVGTIILSNEARSIATIEHTPNSMVYPVRMDDEIPELIKVLQVEPKKVTFVNKKTGHREYVDIPDNDPPGSRPAAGRVAGIPGAGAGVEQLTPTQFNVQRNEVDKALADFNNVLTQARAVPNTENGVPAGYKLFQIVPGSIYDKLGLKNGDVIMGLNGETINDPGKAFEMMKELKMSNHLELQVKKDGKVSTYTYDIR